MATITIYASTGVAKIDLQMPNSTTKTIYENDHYSWTRLDSNSWIKITDVDALSSYSNPYTDNYGNNLNNGHTYYFSGGDQNVYVRATYKPPAATYTIKIKPSTSVPSFSWSMSDGGSGTWSLENDGPEASWTRAEGTELTITSCAPSSSYKHPVYYERTDQFQQQITNSDGTWKDRIITFTADKTGTLVATYVKPVQTYTLSFNPGAKDAIGSMTAKTGATTYVVPRCGFYRDGYEFKDWVYTDDDGFPQTVNVGDTITLTRNLTLYAQWSKIELITISFISKGVLVDEQYITDGLMITGLDDTETEKFDYWYEELSDGSWAKYYDGDFASFSKDTTLYAHWTTEIKDKITITLFDHDLGEEFDLYEGESMLLPIPEDTATEKFEYWYSIDSEGNIETYDGGASIEYWMFDGDTTLYAAWKTTYYTITYKGNGATGGSERVQSNQRTYIVYQNWFTRTGYEFRYWTYADEYDQTVIVHEGDTLTPTRNLQLFASWKKATYSITYDLAGGTGGPSAGTKTHGVTYTIPSTKPTKAGNTFRYWVDDLENIYYPGESYYRNANTTFTAVWKLNTYTITYNLNGGSGGPTSPDTKTHGVTYTIPSTKPTKTGNTFQYWVNDLGNTYYPGGSYERNANTTFSAVWKLNEYTISYNANGGTGAPSEQTKTHGVDLTLSSVVPTRSGYDFVNWYDGTDYYSPGGIYSANSPASLYAQWRRKTYTVSYNANGGTGAPSAQTKTHGVDLTLSSTVPTNGNLRFMGWSTSSAASASAQYASGATYSGNDDLALYAVWRCVAAFYNGSSLLVEKLCPIGGSVTCPTMADSGGKGLYMWQVAHSSQSYSPGASIQNLSESITLLAVWKTFYDISYNANGGDAASVPSSQRKWEDEDLTLSTIIPTWSGHTFFGWSTNSDRMAARQYEAGDTYSKNESAVLYAIWRVVVVCYSNGSQYGSSLYARIGGEITLPSPQPTATQVCTGWKRRDDTTIIYTPGQTLEITISFILDAIWQNGFTLTYNDGGSGGGNSVVHTPLAITYDIWTVGQCHFTKAGSVFQHWSYTDDDGFPQTIKPLQSFTPTRSLTLYAVWKARDKFYWHGSDAADVTYFAVGQRVDLAITATAWNAFLDFVNNVREEAGLARIDFHKVTAGKEFSAFDFNRVRNNIDPMIPNNSSIVLPSTVSAGDEIVTSLYNGTGSLKDAINRIVEQL